MTGALTIGAFGVDVRVALNGLNPDEERILHQSWARCSSTAGSKQYELDAIIETAPEQEQTEGHITAPDASTLAHKLATRITLALIGLARHDLLLLHACALAHPTTGATIALIGPSGSGKTTAAATLGTTLGYVTDETVAVGPNLTVHPYPKPLSIRKPGTHIKTQASPDALGLIDTAETPLRLAAVTLLDRRSDAPETPSLSAVALTDAIAELIPQISYLSERPQPLVHLSETLSQVGGIHKLSYRDVTDLPEAITELLGSPPTAITNTWTPSPTHSTANTGIRRAAVHDAISDGQNTIVLHDNTVRVLDGIAPAIWDAADGATLDQLTDIVIGQHGAPPTDDAHQLVRNAVTQLAENGLLLGAHHSD